MTRIKFPPKYLDLLCTRHICKKSKVRLISCLFFFFKVLLLLCVFVDLKKLNAAKKALSSCWVLLDPSERIRRFSLTLDFYLMMSCMVTCWVFVFILSTHGQAQDKYFLSFKNDTEKVCFYRKVAGKKKSCLHCSNLRQFGKETCTK